jgi:DNA-binding NarL/FixJ family response regulator
MAKKIKLLIVDDHVVLRDGLVSLFTPQPDFEVVGEAGTVSEAVTKACDLEPDLVLMDIGLPDGSGVEATKAILARRPDTDIVILTLYDSDELLMDAIRSGAKGYLLKTTPAARVIASLRALVRGEPALSPRMTGRVMAGLASEKHPTDEEKISAIDHLTARELEVLGEISKGATNKEIAERLFISVNTVKNHVHEILNKLELKNRREAASFAIRHELDD